MIIHIVFNNELISFLIAVIAAIHGVYNNVKIKKLAADSGVKIAFNELDNVDIVVPVKTLIVLITASFAEKPVISEVAILQSPKPSGLNIGDINLPTIASILSELLVTRLIFVSNVCKNHMTIVATKIIVNAFCIKSLALSHISKSTLLSDGNL